MGDGNAIVAVLSKAAFKITRESKPWDSLMHYIRGLKEWSYTLGRIYSTIEVRGIEWLFDLVVFFLMILTPSLHVQSLLWGRGLNVSARFAEWYTATVFVLLWLLLWSNFSSSSWVLLAGYLLATTLIVLFNVTFLPKLSFIGPSVSAERSLLLFIFNLAQTVVTFAIFYRWSLNEAPSDALFKSLLVLGTVGYPTEKGARLIVGSQIMTDILLLAVFLAFFVGKLGSPPEAK